MKNPLLSRYRIKQRRKSKPEIMMDFSAESQHDLNTVLAKHIHDFSCCSALMYSEIWPEWISHGQIQVSIRSVPSDMMAEINDEFRNLKEPTDVLTFPLYEIDGKFVPEKKPLPLLLGDIILCPEQIAQNANLHNTEQLSELALVIFHGMLHLLAWDHDTPERQERMWRVQERFRDLFLNGVQNTERLGS